MIHFINTVWLEVIFLNFSNAYLLVFFMITEKSTAAFYDKKPDAAINSDCCCLVFLPKETRPYMIRIETNMLYVSLKTL